MASLGESDNYSEGFEIKPFHLSIRLRRTSIGKCLIIYVNEINLVLGVRIHSSKIIFINYSEGLRIFHSSRRLRGSDIGKCLFIIFMLVSLKPWSSFGFRHYYKGVRSRPFI